MVNPNLRQENEIRQQCACVNCDISKITNLQEHFRMTSCTNIGIGCKRIRKLFKNGYKAISQTYFNAQTETKKYWDETPVEEKISRHQLVRALTHTLIIKHPRNVSPIKFMLSRYRTCVSIHDSYSTFGFYVSDNSSIAFLKFKSNKRISCYFIDMDTHLMKHADISIDLIDKELCSIYISQGSLWIAQNSEIGVINISMTRLNDNPVRTIIRNFGTMDYWNPNDGPVIFTEFELCQGFLHVTLDSTKHKIIRKQVTTLKNSHVIPIGYRQIVITHQNSLEQVNFEFHKKEGKLLRSFRTIQHRGTFEKRLYTACTSTRTNLAAVRINQKDIFVFDIIQCTLVKKLQLHPQYNSSEHIDFMFSPSGNRLFMLGKSTGVPAEYFWTQHLLCKVKTLKESAGSIILQRYSTDEIRALNLPRTLKRELTLENS